MGIGPIRGINSLTPLSSLDHDKFIFRSFLFFFQHNHYLVEKNR